MPSKLKKCTVVLCGLLAAFFTGGFAQTPDESHFGAPPDSLFNEARYPANPTVPFIYSLKELDITFEQSGGSVIAIMDYHVRVKVFDASTPRASIVSIPFYAQNNIEKITAIHGVTWQSPDKGIKLKPDNIRTININGRYKLKELTMPAVKDGSVIEYSYTVRRRYIEELPPFYLANQMPTVLAKVSITYPQYLRYNAIIEDFKHPITHKKLKDPVTDLPEIFTNPQPDPIVKEVWIARTIPAVQKEKFISTLSDYRGKISFQLSEFGIPRQPLANSWEYVVEEIRQKQKLFETIRHNKKAFEIGARIRASVPSKKAALDSVYSYLLEQVNYNGKRAPFSATPAKAVLAGKKTNQAAINQTLISMLRGAGIKAYPVLISTRNSGKINKGYPSFFQFNGQLVRVTIDGKSYLMDASFSHSEPNLIPVETYNQTGLLLKENTFKWIEINPPMSVFSIRVKMDAELKPDGTLTGHIVTAYRGYPARQIRLNKARGMSTAAVVKRLLFDSYPKVQLSNLELSRLRSFDHPVKITADFTIPDYATVFSDGMRFRPMVVGYLMHNPFDDKHRKLPITLNAPEELRLSYSITLPENYSLAKTLKDRTLKLPGAVFTERYNIEGDTIHYRFHININKKRFKAELYRQLMDLYQRWVQLSRTRWYAD